jgi:3-methyladenine DNA glycosylase/8-oxoguanine DNA glycosylase
MTSSTKRVTCMPRRRRSACTPSGQAVRACCLPRAAAAGRRRRRRRGGGHRRPRGVSAQVARILSLDVDGTGFPAIGQRDPVAGRLQQRYPGLRPVTFWSPYEVAAWTIIGQRIRITQAARIKAHMAQQLGEPVALHTGRLAAFPAPARLAALDGFPGLSDRKIQWLRSLAAAALDGRLDARRLRALPREQALAELRALPGIGGFSAELILLRGAGDPRPLPQPRTSPATRHSTCLPPGRAPCARAAAHDRRGLAPLRHLGQPAAAHRTRRRHPRDRKPGAPRPGARASQLTGTQRWAGSPVPPASQTSTAAPAARLPHRHPQYPPRRFLHTSGVTPKPRRPPHHAPGPADLPLVLRHAHVPDLASPDGTPTPARAHPQPGSHSLRENRR